MSDDDQIDMSWVAHAACKDADPELFFSERSTPEGMNQRRAALRMCEACDVKLQCLSYGLMYERFGIWGGTTAERRSAIRRKYNITARLDRYNLTTSITGHAITASNNRKINDALAKQKNSQQ